MYFEKYLFSYFAVVFIYGICHCESSANRFHENNVMEFNSTDMGSFLLQNNVDSMLILRNDTEWSAGEKECTCKNGRCENTCAERKEGACLRMKQVCVCDPEFGKFDDDTCIYCNCGKGFNCIIDHNSRGDVRKCVCPEGYYDYAGECAPFCTESQPCQNGGTCQNGKCQCLSGAHGPFCERLFWCAYECRPRLIVDCIYNQEQQTYGCQCKNRSLVFDYREWVCKPCPCGEGTCKEEQHQLRCDCKNGYKEYNAQCRKCDCGPDHDCVIHYSTGEKICKCRKGYFLRDGTCLPCECGHEEATCSLDKFGRKICVCPEGYESNFGLCEKKKDNCTCHPTAKCNETDEGFICTCEDGYWGEVHSNPKPGEPCIDIDECKDAQTCPQWHNQNCVNFPGSYMCQCKTGYQPVSAEGGKLTCEKYKVSWIPTGITILVIVLFIAASVGCIMFVKHRESSRNTSGMEMRWSR